MTFSRRRWSERAVDLGVHVLRKAGVDVLSLSPEKMIAHAEKRVPGEKVDEVARQRLEVLTRSFDDDADLNFAGRVCARFQVGSALIARLRLRKLQRERPEIFETPLNRPMIITGLPRSGTTFLHRLLSAAPGARPFAAWELQQPIPPKHEEDRRRDSYRKVVLRIRRDHPEVDVIHETDVDAPEECMCLADGSLINCTFQQTGPCEGYVKWYEQQDKSETYAVYRAMLQLKQFENPGRQLVLKAPGHISQIGVLARAVPEACLIQTHRDPMTATASCFSLFTFLYGITTRNGLRIEPDWAVDTVTRFLGENAKQRVGIEGRIHNVRYPDLTSDPLAVAQGIYASFDLPWTERTRRALEQYVEEHPKNKHGRHDYSLEGCTFTAEELEERFRDYRNRWRLGANAGQSA